MLLTTHAYIIVESCALVHRRLGADAVRVLVDALVPSLSVLYVDRELHERATAAYAVALSNRGVSFVDRVSFETIRHLALDGAFAFDDDFHTEGFQTVPGRASTTTTS